jgi:cytoskeletal protein CcmA (bactofilin family)
VVRNAVSVADQANIGKGLIVKGEISGSESLYIDGRVEGSINLPENLVTVGRNGQVKASITARDIVVLGKVCGNIAASNRVEIRVEGSVTGDVAAARLSIEDGAFFKGKIDIQKTESKLAAAAERVISATEAPKTRPVAHTEAGKLRMQPLAQTA